MSPARTPRSGTRMLARVLSPGLLLAALVFAATAAAQAPPEEPGRIRIGSADVVLSGRVQTQFNTTSVAGEPATEWMIRRARVEARVRVSERVGGKIQPDFSGERFTLKDAYVLLSFSPAAQLLAGQAHRPFGTLTRFSSLRMPPIEKGGEVRGRRVWEEVNLVKDLGYSNRDVGLQLLGAPEGAPLGLEYEAALLQGPDGRRVVEGGAPQLVARVAVSPWEGVSLGGSWARRDFAGAPAGPDEGRARGGSAVALDLAYQPAEPGLLLLGEVVSGDFDPWTGATFRGAQGWLAYDVVPAGGAVSMIEPLLRVSHGALDGALGAEGGTLVTPGLNLYLGGLNRVMIDYDLWLPAGGGGADRSLKAMFQLSF